MMADREKVIKGLEILMNGCEYIHCDDCCFYISTKPTRCGLREEQIQEDALALLKEQEDMGKELTDAMELVHKKNARIIELTDLLKEQEKKQITLHKKHVITWRRNDEFSMRKLYEAICETLLDEGELFIARTDDHEKVDFVFYVAEGR